MADLSNINQNDELKKLVLFRLESMSKNLGVYMDSFGILTREQLINHVQNEDSLGKKIIETQLAYLRGMKDL